MIENSPPNQPSSGEPSTKLEGVPAAPFRPIPSRPLTLRETLALEAEDARKDDERRKIQEQNDAALDDAVKRMNKLLEWIRTTNLQPAAGVEHSAVAQTLALGEKFVAALTTLASKQPDTARPISKTEARLQAAREQTAGSRGTTAREQSAEDTTGNSMSLRDTLRAEMKEARDSAASRPRTGRSPDRGGPGMA